MAGKPTPAWVWKAGAKYAYHKESNTELALFWDPIFREHAMNFMKAVNKHFKNNKEILLSMLLQEQKQIHIVLEQSIEKILNLKNLFQKFRPVMAGLTQKICGQKQLKAG